MVIERCRVATAGNGGGGTFDSLFHGDDATFDGRDDLFGLGFHVRPGNVGINGATLKEAMEDFKDIINKVITGVIIPLLPALYFRYFLEYLEFRTGFRCVGRVREDYRDDIFPDDHTVVYPILHCRNRVEEESVPVVSKYVAGLHDRFGNTVFRRDNSRDVGANDKKWRQPGTSHFRNPALCHDTLVG